MIIYYRYASLILFVSNIREYYLFVIYKYFVYLSFVLFLFKMANIEEDIMQSFLNLANRFGGFSSISNSDPNVKVFGMSSMNVTQISRGPDGRPRVVQAHDERRMGPNGVWQTKKALRDPDRGIDKMQIGYFVGDQGEIIERHYEPTTRQYRQQIQRRNLPQNQLQFNQQWQTQARQTMQPPINNRQQPNPPPITYEQQPTNNIYEYY